MVSKILLVLGIVGIVLGGGAIVVTLIIVLTQGGRVSADEALPGFIGGGICSCISVVLAIIGLVLVMSNRKKSISGPTDQVSP